MKQPGLYFIGIAPPDFISREIRLLKEEISRRFHTVHALKSPPHITLQAPFLWPADDEETLCHFLEDFAALEKPFTITAESFGFFDQRVVFIKIADHQPALKIHHRLLQSVLKKLPVEASKISRQIHPHITLATRDLNPETFVGIWNYVSNDPYRTQFLADSVVLFRHRDKQWETAAEFFFNRG